MTAPVNKQVRFVNIITDISQFCVDIYQSLYNYICGVAIQIMERNKRGMVKCPDCEYIISLFRLSGAVVLYLILP